MADKKRLLFQQMQKPKLTDAYGFVSNRQRKAQQRATYHSAYSGKGTGWMKHGVRPPIKSTYRGGR